MQADIDCLIEHSLTPAHNFLYKGVQIPRLLDITEAKHFKI